MELSEGSARAKLFFALLLAVYLGGVVVLARDVLERIGQPDVGFQIDSAKVSPTREDASEAGLRGGGRALQINGVEVPEYDLKRLEEDHLPELRRDIGATNTIVIERPGGNVREVTIAVRPWEWSDALFTEGATVIIGFLYFVVGVTTFALRPYELASWALLSLCCFSGGVLTTLLVPMSWNEPLGIAYFLTVIGLVPFTIIHAAFAFPVPHTLLTRYYTATLRVVYGLGLLQLTYSLWSWYAMERSHSRQAGSIWLLIALLLFEARCLAQSFRADDRIVRQRARILLAGSILGLGPVIGVNFFQQVFAAIAIDNRLVYWPLGLFLLALARVTLRPQLLSARVTVRRAVIYGWAVGVPTLCAIVLSAIRPEAVALLLPLLYFWPRFDQRLNRRLYPKRARLPEILRHLGDRLAAAETVPAVLEILAEAPGRIADAGSGVALLFETGRSQQPVLAASDLMEVPAASRLLDEPLIQLVRTTRKEVFRSACSVEPQYSNIKSECLACFDRLHAEALLPISRNHQAIGILAAGARANGDTYEQPELDAMSTLIQQAVQSLIRIEATERLRSRELEFAELKRFFPPQVIDQVIARGGAAELRTQRKQVTVVFADLRGFTEFSDSVEPEEVMATLAEYHAAMGRRIARFSGTLERFAGDGFMVFFNDPVEQSDHVERAVRMALAMRSDVRELKRGWLQKGYRIDVGVGIHTGYATCGFIGYEGRRDYGVIGNTTNLAARLSDAAGPGEILVSARVRAELGNDFLLEPAGELHLKGFHQPQPAFRLLAEQLQEQEAVA
ncbi:MAG TPA: adenylate/guanylate cyclase domain-containing protein [Terriglobales bacterium]|nr:adenylate/guanylate cyclase domain-containing protein [Terriglobales bacterium]